MPAKLTLGRICHQILKLNNLKFCESSEGFVTSEIIAAVLMPIKALNNNQLNNIIIYYHYFCILS